MDQNASHIPNISIGDYTLQVVDTFTCLDPTIASNLSLDDELNSRIGKTATAMARLARSAWNNSMLIINTKMKVGVRAQYTSLWQRNMDPVILSRAQT